MKIKPIFINNVKKNNGGFTLIELVMTILLIGILSIGLYQVVMWGISDYVTNERYLHSNNSMTYAMAAIRRSMEQAAAPPSPPGISPSGAYYCKLSANINPATSGEPPIVTANLAGQTTTCGGSNPVLCDEAAFYQNITGGGQQLVVFCVNNNILYEEVTNGTGTASYPIANNISGISF